MSPSTSPSYASGLKVELVQVLFRHGERMPMKPPALFAPFTQAPPWSDLRTQVRVDSKRTSPELSSGAASGKNSAAVSEQDDEYTPNDLTTLGHQTTRAIGQRLRQRYVEDLQFLPATLGDSTQLHMRSSILPRSYNSLESVFETLYPPASRDAGHERPAINTREPQHENLYPNRTHGPRLRELTGKYQQWAAQKWNGSAEVAHLQELLSMAKEGHDFQLAVDSAPSMEQVRDYIICKSATKSSPDEIPACFRDQRALRTMENICIDFRLSGFIESAEIRALGVGTLLGEVVGRMKSIGGMIPNDDGSTTPKFVLLSSHDTTLAIFLICLEAAQEVRWPWFSTTLVFELFSRQEESVQYYVRLLWNDQIVSLPRLDQNGSCLEGHEGVYSLDKFVQLVDERTASPAVV